MFPEPHLVSSLITFTSHSKPAVRGAEGVAERNGNLLSNEGEAPNHVVLLGEHVHTPSSALAAASRLSKQLSHDFAHRYAFARCVDVVAVSRDNSVVLTKKFNDPSTDSLLSSVQVDKARSLAHVVEAGARVFDHAAQQHVFQEHLPYIGRDYLSVLLLGRQALT